MPAATSTFSPSSQAPNVKATQPKRPPNAFLCFRSHYYSQLKAQDERDSMADVSKKAGFAWRQRTEEEAMYWDTVAAEKKRQHELLYPDYVYRPAPAGEKKRLQAEKQRAREDRKRERDEKRREKGQCQPRGASSGNSKASRGEPYPSTAISTHRLTNSSNGTPLPIQFNNYTPQSFVESPTYPTYPAPAPHPVYAPSILPMHALPFPIALPPPAVWPPVRMPVPRRPISYLPGDLELLPAASSSRAAVIEDDTTAALFQRVEPEQFIPTEDTGLSAMDREYESPKDEFSGFDSASDWDGLSFTPFDDSEDNKSTPNDTDIDHPMTPSDEMSTTFFAEEQMQNLFTDSAGFLDNSSPPGANVEETVSLTDKAVISSVEDEMWDSFIKFDE